MTPVELKTALLDMMMIRAFEDRVARARDDGQIPGLPHLSHGHEAVAVGVCRHLDSNRDMVTGSHRSHAQALAIGVDPVALMAELMGRETGLGRGMGGTQHFFAPENGFLASNGIVGGQVPMAAGAALSARAKGDGGIAVTFFGDGAINQGGVMETMNLAAALKLPLLFVVENNGLAQSTGSDAVTAGPGATARAKAMAMAAEKVDGSNFQAVTLAAKKLVDYVRASAMPALLEATVTRISGHYHGDKQPYRSDGKTQDPIYDLAERLGLGGDDLDQIMAGAINCAEDTFQQAASGKPSDGNTTALVAQEVL